MKKTTSRFTLSFAVSIISATQAFLPPTTQHPSPLPSTSCVTFTSASTASTPGSQLRMSFMADSSDYKPQKSDYGEGGEDGNNPDSPLRGEVEMADVPVTEEIPVPMSRNNVGNRFLAVVFDRSHSPHMSDGGNDAEALWEMHRDRIALTEQHVMWARKQNLYNETFNTGSMADVLWSHQILSSDLQRTIGHAMCIDSPTVHHCREALSRDPIVRSLLGVDPESGACDASSVPLYRWRQIRDHTLRRDDGRDGVPYMVLSFDRPEAAADGVVRREAFEDHLEYLIRSERVISAGPLHVATEEKTDPESIAVGTLLFFNAKDRGNAVEFVENDPACLAGLYETVTVHRFNNLDVTGKFVSENLYFPEQNTYQMKDAMGHWGYPVDDQQTKWLNW